MALCGSGFREGCDEIGMCLSFAALGASAPTFSDSRPVLPPNLIPTPAWVQATWAPANSRHVIRGFWAGLRQYTGKSGPVLATVGAPAPELGSVTQPAAEAVSWLLLSQEP